jgi:hypothetical protein
VINIVICSVINMGSFSCTINMVIQGSAGVSGLFGAVL